MSTNVQRGRQDRVPGDAFFASGDLGQRMAVLPSQHLVIVRLGDSIDPTGDIRGLGGLVKEVIAATQHGGRLTTRQYEPLSGDGLQIAAATRACCLFGYLTRVILTV
jgi:CubicO group peptidase (beta-lactamase class C family)